MILAPPFLKGTETKNFSLQSDNFFAIINSVLSKYRVASIICMSFEITVTGSSRTN
jgi:hypothetical protein